METSAHCASKKCNSIGRDQSKFTRVDFLFTDTAEKILEIERKIAEKQHRAIFQKEIRQMDPQRAVECEWYVKVELLHQKKYEAEEVGRKDLLIHSDAGDGFNLIRGSLIQPMCLEFIFSKEVDVVKVPEMMKRIKQKCNGLVKYGIVFSVKDNKKVGLRLLLQFDEGLEHKLPTGLKEALDDDYFKGPAFSLQKYISNDKYKTHDATRAAKEIARLLTAHKATYLKINYLTRPIMGYQIDHTEEYEAKHIEALFTIIGKNFPIRGEALLQIRFYHWQLRVSINGRIDASEELKQLWATLLEETKANEKFKKDLKDVWKEPEFEQYASWNLAKLNMEDISEIKRVFKEKEEVKEEDNSLRDLLKQQRLVFLLQDLKEHGSFFKSLRTRRNKEPQGNLPDRSTHVSKRNVRRRSLSM